MSRCWKCGKQMLRWAEFCSEKCQQDWFAEREPKDIEENEEENDD